MSTPETITSRLHAKADKELEKKIKAAITAFQRALLDVGVNTYYMKPSLHRSFLYDLGGNRIPVDSIPERIVVDFDQLIKVLPESAFAIGFESNRIREVTDFMKRVDELGARCDELQQQIDGVTQ